MRPIHHYAYKAHRFRACASIRMSDTRARLWDASAPGSYEQVLDDDALREKLKDLSSFWEVDIDAAQGQPPKFLLLTIPLEPTSLDRTLQIRPDTLRAVLHFAGLGQDAADKIIHNLLFVTYYNFQFEEGDDVPTGLTMVWRCPVLSESLLGVARIQFRTRNCFIWMSCFRPEDTQELVSRAARSPELLRIHPLYFVSFIFDHLFVRWTDRISLQWQALVEIETATGMVHPALRLVDFAAGDSAFSRNSLSSSDALLKRLHETHYDISHAQGIMDFAVQFGEKLLRALAEVEDGRGLLGCRPLPRRQRDGLEERVRTTLTRCRAMQRRLSELASRLSGQINVSFNLIAQRDSKINFEIAKLQAHDSRTVKGIAILTLSFLPTTLVATLWTTNLFTISGDRNWQTFVAVVTALTAGVFACWWTFGQVSKKRHEKRWPAGGLDSLSPPPLPPS